MKNQKKVFVAGGLLLILFIVVSTVVFIQSNQQIKNGYLASEGSAAKNFAVLTAANISLTDARVAELKEMSYAELLNSEENRALVKMMSNTKFANKVDYAYIMVHLKNDEVKYTVTPEVQSRFDVPVGTKLDILWLLDVNVSAEASENVLNNTDSELSRYAYYIDEDAQVFSETPTYIYNSSEWGDHICGYAPIYTVEGNYIGAVGVELQVADYMAYCGTAVFSMGLLMAVTLCMLTVVFWYIYHNYRKLQLDKIYTDALTRLGNRSFYNDRFIRLMNASRHGKPYFALMIADIDLFKKVNDTFGHEVGDAVLLEMGAIFLNVFDKKQVVRFGGEEFVAGVWVNSEQELTQWLDKLFAAVHGHKFSNQQLTIGLSLGCCYYPTNDINGWLSSGMLRAADCNLYFCKGNGRDQYKVEQYNPKKEYKK